MVKSDIESKYNFYWKDGMSTIVAFIPNEIYFDDPTCKVITKSLIYINLIMEKFYNKSADIVINGKSMKDSVKPYKFEFIQEVCSSKTGATAKFYVTFECDNNLSVNEQYGSVNSLVVNRGKHIDYASSSYSSALKDYFSIDHDYTMNGLRMMVIVLAGEVDFSSQTKERLTKLCNIGWNDLNPLYQAFRKILRQNQDYFQVHVERLNELAKSLQNISTIEKVKQMVSISSVDGKKIRGKLPKCVSDASSDVRKSCELFIVEGRSAGSQLMKVRNSKTQAVLRLIGVPKNSINITLDEMLENEEMKALISTIGCGVNEYHTTEDPRYGKIIIAADADADGGRIASLVASIIAKKMTFLIEEGMVFIVETPIYKQGKKYIFPSDDIEKELDRSKSFTQLKGLGELQPEDVKYTMCDVTTRRLKKITLEGSIEALSIMTTTAARKDLIINSGTLTDPYNLGIRI